MTVHLIQAVLHIVRNTTDVRRCSPCRQRAHVASEMSLLDQNGEAWTLGALTAAHRAGLAANQPGPVGLSTYRAQWRTCRTR